MKDVLGVSSLGNSCAKKLSEYVVTSSVYINISSSTHPEAENPKIGSHKASLHMGWITDRLVVRFKKQITTIRTVKEVVRTIQEGDHGLGTQLGKRKHDQEPNLPIITEDLDVTTSRGNQRSVHPRIKFGRCREKGHKHQKCILEV